MNKLEYEMINVLKSLKRNHGVFQIKAEFENEGSRQVELMRLKDVTSRADLPIILKIGGVEAVTDIYEALSIGAQGIVAPMAETAFATSKFLNAIDTFVSEDNRQDIEFAINVETITAYNNLSDILSLDKIKLLSSITVGRVDFTASLGGDRSFANSDVMLTMCSEIFEKCKKVGLKTAIGGAISPDSMEFIRTLAQRGLIDKFETRKVVYSTTSLDAINKRSDKDFNAGLSDGVKFELLWLKSKRRYYHKITTEDEKRIEMLEKRVVKL